MSKNWYKDTIAQEIFKNGPKSLRQIENLFYNKEQKAEARQIIQENTDLFVLNEKLKYDLSNRGKFSIMKDELINLNVGIRDCSFPIDGIMKITLREFSDTFNFEDLEKISKILGTKHINLSSETREGGYCETCRYTTSVLVLECAGVTL